MQIIEELTTALNTDCEEEDDEGILLLLKTTYKHKPQRINRFVENIALQYSEIEFQQNFRLSYAAFDFLLEQITPLIEPHYETLIIPIKKQLLASIWLLANQECYRYCNIFIHK